MFVAFMTCFLDSCKPSWLFFLPNFDFFLVGYHAFFHLQMRLAPYVNFLLILHCFLAMMAAQLAFFCPKLFFELQFDPYGYMDAKALGQ